MAKDGQVIYKVKADLSDYNKDMDSAKSTAQKVFDGVSTAGKVAFAAIGAAAVTAAGKLVGMVKDSLDAVGNYEQLTGGVETLFKDSADIVMRYAENAYKTAGLSANQYMETVTSFSASLLQGLNGDTAKAAQVADLAITDMADNANKMGTSMEAIQNAYQGFAKQNYTMLDNLKLGYGGTATEMVRLINDANKVDSTILGVGETIKDLNGITFDQIIQSIHVV
jgi:phage-related protein